MTGHLSLTGFRQLFTVRLIIVCLVKRLSWSGSHRRGLAEEVGNRRMKRQIFEQ